ncbi:5'-methylthioadenosine/S-adenosylhomocysteine nucleosidase [Acuticoccus mangrovi]|uniref:5'-methylthioadenosine/S-adenosylhomocysteine nucleosidase n=1 Tax=Acuticoccus mangrovi TaxID=2796142 RepID=A0A934IP93_9HYPH|nr:5'-methylthioadenosine/S-adenosylhomocysteine nucleosidase [Acuticoccus mangrovi]MBJ3775807.1 5'-methylthioadenosine/S-adenosylhomocysteine nucleosidase [Acuticoccus mangrovi]
MFLRTLAVAAAIAAATVAASAAERLDDTSRIAVLSAFEPEWLMLQEMVEGRADHLDNGVRYVTGSIEGRDVVLLLSGIGMVNAAMTAQMAIDRFDLTGIVFSGIAGGVDPALNVGDVVVPEHWGSYLHMVFARETEDGGFAVPPFLSAPFANFGMIFPQNEQVRHEGEETPQSRFWFDVDPDYLAAAREAAARVVLNPCREAGVCLEGTPQITVGGNGVSGSAFVDNADFRRYVFDTFAARVIDMESAAVAQVAFANGVPFIAFRSLSDLAGGGEGSNELPIFFAIAAENSATLVAEFLHASSEDGEVTPLSDKTSDDTAASTPQ